MDKYLIFLKRAFVVLMMMLVYGNLYAIEFEVDGIKYRGRDNDNTASVLGKNKNYTGAIAIPKSVSYQGVNYTVTTVSEGAFSGNKDITSIVIPPTITFMDEGAFYQCVNLDAVYISNIESWCKIEFDDDDANPLYYANHLFVDGKETNEIIIPDGITEINEWAFICFKGISSLSLPNSCKYIWRGAFCDCSNLKMVISKCTTPSYMDSDYSSPFTGISPNAKLIVPQGTINLYLARPYWSNYFAEIVEDVNESSNNISFSDANVKAICIANWDTNGDGELSKEEAAAVTDLKTVFKGTKITSFNELQYFTGLTSIAGSAFYECYSLGSITMPNNVTSIGSFAFQSCTNLKSFTIPSGVKSIGGWAFAYCTSLTSMLIPNGVATIEDKTFGGCNRLTSITIPSSVTSIGEGAFAGCISLLSFTIPNNVTRIGIDAFLGCSSITTITIPNSVKSIGNQAFYSCTGLTSIISEIEKPFAIKDKVFQYYDNGYKTLNAILYVPYGTKSSYKAADGWKQFINIIENATSITHTLSINVSGNGYVAYDGNTVRGKTSSFSVEEGTNAVLKFSADEGNRLKSVKLNGQDVTSTIVNNQYTISNITTNTTVEVAFEAIPNYLLNIVASGNGNAVYNGTTIRNQSKSFTLQEGSSAIISFTPDNGYRIKSVKVNNTDVTSQVANGQITISNIVQDTNVEVSFEEIPPTTYSLTITAIGNGAITYDGNSIRGGSSTFTVVEGSYVTVQIAADDGYRLKRVTYNGNDLTASDVSGQFTTDKITANATLTVEFEAIPTFSLTIKSSAFGCVKYGNAVITNQTEAFTVREGTEAVMTFIPDGNGRLQRITLNGSDITSELVNGQYTISNIRADQSVEVEYVEDITKVTDAGVAYTVTSYDEGTVVVAAGNYGQVLTIPASFTAKGKTWTVTGIDSDALTDATELAAIIWEPEVPFTAQVSNPNLLLYVKQNQYAQSNVQNVVVGDENEGEALMADNIVLTEAESGNNFYCPKAFEAKRISYEHNYSMISGYKDCQGWETIVLPFDVTVAINTKGTELVPYSTWTYGSNLRPFWLYQMTNQGWQAANGIKANVPYIISMPNNEMYESSYNLTGNIQFIGNNVQVMPSDNPTTGHYGNKQLVANYQDKPANNVIYALNVSNEWCQNTAAEKEGSTFIRSLRNVHPFEAYMTVEGSNAPWAIPIFEGGTTNLTPIPSPKGEGRYEWYDLQGRKLQGEPTKNGLYINKGKKIRK